MSLSLRFLLRRAVSLSLLLCLVSAAAATRSPGRSELRAIPDRISGPVDTSQRVPLPNNLPLWANPQNAQEPASGQMNLTVVLSRSPQQQAELEKLLADQKNPASPDFHHWLTPSEVGARFGVSSSDLDAVQEWLMSQGLHVTWTSPSRMFVGVNGDASDVGRAFGTEVRTYFIRGNSRSAVATAPTIPAALAPVISSVYGLYTIPDRPSHLIVSAEKARADLTLTNGDHWITPVDFRTIYDGPTSQPSSQPVIGIVGRSRVDSADITNFGQTLGYGLNLPVEVVPSAFGGVDPGPAYTIQQASNVPIGDQSEATLDVTRAGTVAFMAKTLLVVATQASGGIEADAQYLVQTSPLPAPVISISFGACESEAGPSGVNFWNTLFEQAALEGITVLVASGDSGASGCEQAFTIPSPSPQPNSPNYICSSPYATCVGGTEFNDTATPSQYWNSTNGPSLNSALGYIPEGAWNEPLDARGNPQLAATGGGLSSIIPTPAWQSGPGVPTARAGRYTPDISFSASCHNAYFGCLTAAGAACTPDATGAIRFVGFCGTSAAAPGMAAVIATLDVQTNMLEGNINPELYALAQSHPSSFHDSTPATSGVSPCSLQTPSMCNNSAPGTAGLSGGQAGYALTAGYDETTGLGSIDITNFLQNFASALPAPSFTFNASATSITAGDPLTITVTLAGGSGQPTPTGWLQLTNPGYNSSAVPLVSGSATFSVGAGVLGMNTGGRFTASYIPDDAGSATYARGVATYSVAIQYIHPTITATFTPASPSVTQNIQITVNIGVGSGDPLPTGTVTVSSSGGTPLPGNSGHYFGTAALSSGTAVFNIAAGSLAYGTDYFVITYSPDQPSQNYYPQSGIYPTLTVAPGIRTIPTISTSLSASTISLSDSVTITTKLTPASGTPMPTGTIYTFPPKAVHPIDAPLDSNGVGKLVVPGTSMNLGDNSLDVIYNSDYNNQAVESRVNVQVTKANASVSVSPQRSSIFANELLQVLVSVSGVPPLPAPSGTITLTGGTFTSSPSQLYATIYIPAGSLPVGTDTISVTYSGDANYSPSTATATVTVSAADPSFTIKGPDLTISRGATSGNTIPVTITSIGGFSGAVSLTAAIKTGPAGAQNPPVLSFGGATSVNLPTSTSASATLTVITTAPATGALSPPLLPGASWSRMGSVLACLFLIGIPAAKRRKLYGCARILLLLVFCSALLACGGAGSASSSNLPPAGNLGTTPGAYVVAITGTSGSLTTTATVNLTIQ